MILWMACSRYQQIDIYIYIYVRLLLVQYSGIHIFDPYPKQKDRKNRERIREIILKFVLIFNYKTGSEASEQAIVALQI